MAALDAARDVVTEAATHHFVLTSCLRGETCEVAKSLIGIAEKITATATPVEPSAILLGGDRTTVSISGKVGTGGPNQELVLSAT